MRAICWRALVACLLAAAVVSPGRADLAAGGEIRLDSEPTCMEAQPDLAALPGGGFVAVWQQGGISGPPRVFARIFGADRLPLGPEFQVSGDTGSSPEVAANAAGNFLVVWRDGADRVRSRAFSSAGLLLGAEQAVTGSAASGAAVTALGNGGFAVLTTHPSVVFLWRVGPTGEPEDSGYALESVIYIDGPPRFPYEDPTVAAYGPSGVAVGWAWVDEPEKQRLLVSGVVRSPGLPLDRLPAVLVPFEPSDPETPRLVVAANAAGRVLALWDQGDGAVLHGRIHVPERPDLGAAFTLPAPAVDALSIAAPDAVATPAGDFLVAWQYHSAVSDETEVRVARVSDAGQLVEPPLQVWSGFSERGPALAVAANGQAVVAWETSVRDHPAIPVCMSLGLFARSVVPASDVLRLRDGRFEVRAGWTDHAGNSGRGHATRLTEDSGSFWFFGPENVELIVKVLDGRAVNDHHWVFYGSLSDVAFTVEVTDTVTGQAKTYENPAGRMASRADTAAFPGTGAASDHAATASGISSVAARSHLPGTGSGGDGPCTRPDLPVLRRPGLCLGDRFEVEVAWHANGGTGDAGGVRLTGDSGYLWFFNPANIELVVKVLDGRAVNGRFWVFYGALTDVEYTVLVRDSWTGQVRTYHNPAGQLRSRADTAAF